MPEEKRQVEETLKEAIQDVQSTEQADRVLDDLERVAEGVTEAQAARAAEASPARPAEAVKQAAETAPPGEKAATTIATTAAEVVAPQRQAGDTLDVAQDVLIPEARGRQPAPEIVKPRGYLQEAALRRMTPFEAWDAHLFIAVNHLPHNKLTNTFMYALTVVATGGVCWSLGALVAYLRGSSRGTRALREFAPSVTIATWLVEYPIKAYFRRKRPFIEIVRALVIGKKPGSWSFPSGHTASSFASARVLSTIWPEYSAAYYALAGLVGFSRTYLGAHYPGDVLSGAFAGTVLSEVARRGTRTVLARRSRGGK
jgi:undecaprenyl-diphosphatase